MEGSRLCCRYSLVTNELGYCGPRGAAESLRKSILGEDIDVSGLLFRFEALYPYLEIIAKKHGLDPFDEKVVEAYWTGNELSEGFKEKELNELVDLLRARGLPQSMCDKLLENPPNSMPFTHNFHVFYVGVGNVTGSVPTTVANMDKCRISCGHVEKVGENFAIVSRKQLLPDLSLSEFKEDKIEFDPGLLSIKEGDHVSIHWARAMQVLNPAQVENLDKLTHQVLKIH